MSLLLSTCCYYTLTPCHPGCSNCVPAPTRVLVTVTGTLVYADCDAWTTACSEGFDWTTMGTINRQWVCDLENRDPGPTCAYSSAMETQTLSIYQTTPFCNILLNSEDYDTDFQVTLDSVAWQATMRLFLKNPGAPGFWHRNAVVFRVQGAREEDDSDCIDGITLNGSDSLNCAVPPTPAPATTLATVSSGNVQVKLEVVSGIGRCPGGSSVTVDNDLSAHVGKVITIEEIQGSTPQDVCYTVSRASCLDVDASALVTLDEATIASITPCGTDCEDCCDDNCP